MRSGFVSRLLSRWEGRWFLADPVECGGTSQAFRAQRHQTLRSAGRFRYNLAEASVSTRGVDAVGRPQGATRRKESFLLAFGYVPFFRVNSPMHSHSTDETGTIQHLVARTVASHPAGLHLLLIGGFRYRLLNHSVRRPLEIDYHWAGDAAAKQEELIQLFRDVLLPEVRTALGLDGQAAPLPGHHGHSPALRVVDLAFWREGALQGRVEIPVQISRIARADPLSMRAARGTVYPTVSDADLVESTIMALLQPPHPHRHMVDLFLFQDHFLPNSAARLKDKLEASGVSPSLVKKRMADLKEKPAHHAQAIQEIIDTQLEPDAAAPINAAGGGELILGTVCELLDRHLLPGKPREQHR